MAQELLDRQARLFDDRVQRAAWYVLATMIGYKSSPRSIVRVLEDMVTAPGSNMGEPRSL
jgi:hypothetical protein